MDLFSHIHILILGKERRARNQFFGRPNPERREKKLTEADSFTRNVTKFVHGSKSVNNWFIRSVERITFLCHRDATLLKSSKIALLGSVLSCLPLSCYLPLSFFWSDRGNWAAALVPYDTGWSPSYHLIHLSHLRMCISRLSEICIFTFLLPL